MQITPQAFVLGLSAIGAALTMACACMIGLAQGKIATAAVESIARQPEASGAITQTMIVGQAISETTGIFAFIIAIVLAYINPLVGMLAK